MFKRCFNCNYGITKRLCIRHKGYIACVRIYVCVSSAKWYSNFYSSNFLWWKKTDVHNSLHKLIKTLNFWYLFFVKLWLLAFEKVHLNWYIWVFVLSGGQISSSNLFIHVDFYLVTACPLLFMTFSIHFELPLYTIYIIL